MNRYIGEGTPTQVAHPGRAVLRTVVAAGVSLLVTLAARWGLDFTAVEAGLVDYVTGVVWTLVTGLVTWFLTLPRVNAWIEKYAPMLATGVHKEMPRIPSEEV